MASYFEVTSEADKKLLPPGYRGHAELENVALIVEADVIGHYTTNPPYTLYTAIMGSWLGESGSAGFGIWSGYFGERGIGIDITTQGLPSGADPAPLHVYLRGYQVDANDAKTDPNLKTALKRTVADVIVWRLNHWTSIEPGVAVSTGTEGGVPKSKAFRPTAEDAFPPDWDRNLERFDSRPVSWSL